ncbi:MAG: hypothetical protein ACD_79C00911G0007 [uncultured bacterium]|nr:MAG: hypothetical protein ACD_79C00911G0007 [uncultured bacterium]
MTNSELNLHIISWILVSTRIGAFFINAPIFGSAAIPPNLKGYFTAILAYFIYQSPQVHMLEQMPQMWDLMMLLIKETTVGVVIAMLTHLIYVPMQIVGEQIGQSSGLGQAQIFNPDEEYDFTVLEQIIYTVAILIFLGLNGHHLILNAFIKSYDYIPLGEIALSGYVLKVFIAYFTKTFYLGIAFAAPILGCLLIVSIGMGLLSKSVPQMNLLIIDLPLRVLIAFLGILFALPIMIMLFKKLIFNTMPYVEKIIFAMSKGAS